MRSWACAPKESQSPPNVIPVAKVNQRGVEFINLCFEPGHWVASRLELRDGFTWDSPDERRTCVNGRRFLTGLEAVAPGMNGPWRFAAV